MIKYPEMLYDGFLSLIYIYLRLFFSNFISNLVFLDTLSVKRKIMQDVLLMLKSLLHLYPICPSLNLPLTPHIPSSVIGSGPLTKRRLLSPVFTLSV